MPPQPSKSDNSNLVWGAIVTVVVFSIAISQCSVSKQTPSQAAAAQFSQETGNAIAALAPPSVEPLDQSSVRQGLKDAKVATAAEGISGAMIYSQNCYEGLTHKFSWHRLDTCGAADILVSRSINDDDTDKVNEVAYFESETAAGRYLAAATGAGQEGSDADLRLEAMKKTVDKSAAVLRMRSQVPQAVPPSDAVNADEELLENFE